MFFSDRWAEQTFLTSFSQLTTAVVEYVKVKATPVAVIPQPSNTLDDVKLLDRSGRRIEAIKMLRQLTGATLKDAKDVVEFLTNRDNPFPKRDV